MLSRSKAVAAAAAFALVSAAPVWAGQMNLANRVTTDAGSVTTAGGGGVTTIFTSSIVQSVNSVTQTVVNSLVVTESFSAGSASVSFEVAQDGINYTSPFDNIFVSTIDASIVATSTKGAAVVQTSIGAGNVSVSSNSIVDGGALAAALAYTSAGNTASESASGVEVLALALTPGFALQNSNVNALVLAAAAAIAGSGDGPGSGATTAIDVRQTDLNEYSPHGNIAAIGSTLLAIVADSNTGLSAVQTQVGAGNVQAAHTVIVPSGAAAGTVLASISGF